MTSCSRGGSAASIRSEQGPDPRCQFPGAERLGDVVVGSEVQAGHAVGLVAPDGDEDDRNRRLGPDAAQGLEPVHLGHHDVEHDQVHGVARVQGFEGLDSVLGGDDVVTLDLEVHCGEADDVRLVVHHHYGALVGGGHGEPPAPVGSVMVNEEPLPGSLATEISPWCAFIMASQMYRPSPMPRGWVECQALGAVEPLEDATGFPTGHAHPGVADGHADAAEVIPLPGNDHRAAVRRILDCVVHQVDQHLFQQVRVAGYRRQVFGERHGQRVLPGGGLEPFDYLFGDAGHVDLLEVQRQGAGFQAGCQQQAVHELAHAVGLFLDGLETAAQGLAVPLSVRPGQGVGVALDDGQRGLELMLQHGEEG